MSSATLLIAHGSPEARSNSDFLKLVKKFTKKHAKGKTVGAFLKLADPGIFEGIEICVRSGATEIFVLPLMFFWGRHVKEDIPKLIEDARARYPGIRFHCAGAMTDAPEFLNFLQHCVQSLKGNA